MHRRAALSILGAMVASPLLSRLSADELVAVGRTVHRRARRGALRALDPRQAETVAAIAEMIIPETDTPGARAAQVHRFIDLLLAEWFPDDERTAFLAGLADVDVQARAAFGADFLAGTETQRAAILGRLDAEVQASRRPEKDRRGQPPFFASLKWLTVYGYYTSEVGAKAELRYETVPGAYDGCTALGHGRAAPGDF